MVSLGNLSFPLRAAYFSMCHSCWKLNLALVIQILKTWSEFDLLETFTSRWVSWEWGFLWCIVLNRAMSWSWFKECQSHSDWCWHWITACVPNFLLALKQNRRYTAFDNPSNPLRLHVSDRAAIKSVRSKLRNFLLHLSLCSLQFGSSRLCSSCVFSVSKLQAFANAT